MTSENVASDPSIVNGAKIIDLAAVRAFRHVARIAAEQRQWHNLNTPIDDGPPEIEINAPDYEIDPDDLGPQSDDPLRGLEHLPSIAVTGAARIRDLAAQPIVWVWQDLAVAGTIVVLAGPSAEGKTTLLFLILLARAGSEPTTRLGRRIEPAPPGQYIVLIEAEHGDRSTARKLVKSQDMLGLGDDALDRIIAVSRKEVRLRSAAWQEIETLIARGLVSDIAIDTLARVGNGDANTEKDQQENFAIIASAIEKAPLDAQPIAWVLAHTRKGAANSLDDVSGSSQRVAQADTVLLVTADRDGITKRVQSTTMVLFKPREEPDEYPEPLTIKISDGTLTVSEGDELLDGNGLTRLAQTILEKLKLKSGEAVSVNYLSRACGTGGKSRNADDIKAAAAELVEAKLAEQAPGVYNGQAFIGYRSAK